MALGDRFPQKIPVRVNSKEQNDKRVELEQVDRDLLKVQADKASDMADYNERLKDLRAKQKTLLDTIESGVEEQEIQVYERLNDQTGQVEMVRVDNGKILPEFTRPLSAEERQLDITQLDPNGTGKTKRGRGNAAAEAGGE